MCAKLLSRGFHGKRYEPADGDRLPPGQYLVTDFPVLSAGPTPYTPEQEWTFSLEGEIDSRRRWTWEEFQALPRGHELGVTSHSPGSVLMSAPAPKAILLGQLGS